MDPSVTAARAAEDPRKNGSHIEKCQMNTQHIFGRPSKNSGFVFRMENILTFARFVEIAGRNRKKHPKILKEKLQKVYKK